MKCRNCNTDVPDNSIFCPECGLKLEPVQSDPVTDSLAMNKETENGQFSPSQESASYGEAINKPDEPKQNQPFESGEPPRVIYPGRESVPNYFVQASAMASTAPYGAVKERNRDAKNGYAVASLVISLINVFCFFFTAFPLSVTGIIFGAVGIRSNRKSAAVIGLVFSILCIIISLFVGLFIIISIANNSPEDFRRAFESFYSAFIN